MAPLSLRAGFHSLINKGCGSHPKLWNHIRTPRNLQEGQIALGGEQSYGLPFVT